MMKRTKVGDLESDIHGFMPQAFVLMYYDLVTRGLKGHVDSIEKSRRGLGVTNGSGAGSEGAVLLSEAALARKRVIDRKLREMAREGRTDAPKCASCGTFGRDGWKYCAQCGVVWGKKVPEQPAPVPVQKTSAPMARKWVTLR